MSLSGVTFEPCHVLTRAWQEVKGEAASVDDRRRLELWAWLCGGGVAPPMQDMRSAVVWAVLYCVICVHSGGVDAVFFVGCVEG